MTIEKLIRQLQTFDPKHTVSMKIEYDTRYKILYTDIDDVRWENGECILWSVHD